MENRSFDHFFGWYPRADGKNSGLAYPDAEGEMVATHHLSGDYQGCGFRDPDHSWDGGRFQWGRGKMNGFVMGNREGTGSDEFAASYYLEGDLPFIPQAAHAFTLYDRWFTSLMASTFPNRHYQMAAQSGGTKSNALPPQAGYPLGFTWETIFDRALANGVSVGYYVSDLPAPGLYGERAKAWTRPAQQFYLDAAAGTLPRVCFIDPPFGDIGALGGGASDHPHSDIRLGQAFMSDVVHAFIESPQFRRGAMFINYDEWGGFFDHVEPVFVADDRSSHKLSENFGLTGFRVPTVAISPYAAGGRVSHMTATHESILKLISYRYRLGHLTKRHRYASNIGRSFNFERPRFDPPSLPDPVAIVAAPCSPLRRSADPASKPAPHDLVRLQASGYLDRINFPTYEATPENIFRNPDSIAQALRESSRP